MSEEREQLVDEAAHKVARALDCSPHDVEPAVKALLADWRVQRHETASGVEYTIKTPRRPLNQMEEDRRRQWRELQQARREWLNSESAEPPPPSVNALDLLGQTTWWRTRDSTVMRLTEMTPSHRSNLLEYMKKNSFGWQMKEYLSTPAAFFGEGMPEEVIDENPDAWMKRQPLYRALKKLVKKDRKAASAE